MENPYAADNVSSVALPAPASTTRTESDDAQGWVFENLSASRNAIVLVASTMSLFSCMIILGLVGNLVFSSPSSYNAPIGESLFWISMQIARSICYGVIALQLWKYQRAIKRCASSGDMTHVQFAALHNRSWKITAVMFIVLTAISVLHIWFSLD